MRPITKQLVVAAFILTLVTVLSLGIRQVRFGAHRADTIESPIVADTEPDHYPADSHAVDVEPDPQPANASDSDVDAEPDPQHANTSDSDEEAPFDYYSKPKSSNGNYAKSEGSKELERISLGDYENLYITGEGELWYVSEQPDGSTAKMQLYTENINGEITIVGIVDSGKSEGSEGLEKVSLGDYENLYITGEGELWYVSEQPGGSGTKMQVQIDDITGEITVVDVK
ncbi:MAG: hypothetical protein PVJ86_11965 [Phycisphaerales bacterium]|jgi:hypothetical protein